MGPSPSRKSNRGRGLSLSTAQKNLLTAGLFTLSGVIYLILDLVSRDWRSLLGTAIWIAGCCSWLCTVKL